MKVIVIAHRAEDAGPEDFAPYLEPEANHVLGMYRDEIVREGQLEATNYFFGVTRPVPAGD